MATKKALPQITLIGIDCVDLDRLKLAADICEKDFQFGSVKLLSSIPDTDSRVVPIPPISSTIAYSEFCIKEMWKYVDTEFALVFQHDGFILNPAAWTDKFLTYDYIGAPWYHMHDLRVGNGGFSLRSKRLLDFIAKNWRQINGALHPEDVWISKYARLSIEKGGMQFAPERIAEKFSFEGNQRTVVWNSQFGFHGATYTNISNWLMVHPEYKERITPKLNSFTQLMSKYPVYDGTVHVLKCKPIQTKHYRQVGRNDKKYDCRMEMDLEEENIADGHGIVYKPHKISITKIGLPPFERIVQHIEKFTSKKELLKKYPDIEITPSFNLPKWKQYLVRFFGNYVFPQNSSYTILFF